MDQQLEDAKALAREKGWPLRVIQAPNWYLWMKKPTRADWLVVGAHGASDHKYDVAVANLRPMKIHFLTQKFATAPGYHDSWYVRKVVEGGRWSVTTMNNNVRNTESGLIETMDTSTGQLPFDYILSNYHEHSYAETITDMYESQEQSDTSFDAITIRGNTSFSEVLRWLSSKPQTTYPNVIAGFCNSSSRGDESNQWGIETPFGKDYQPPPTGLGAVPPPNPQRGGPPKRKPPVFQGGPPKRQPPVFQGGPPNRKPPVFQGGPPSRPPPVFKPLGRKPGAPPGRKPPVFKG